MIWLACETSTHRGGLALFNKNTVLAYEMWERDGSHSEFITVAFQKMMTQTNILPQQIDLFAVGTGPGSFTGIRVGINFIRALAQSLNKRIINLNSLHLLALQPRLSSSYKVRVVQYAFRNLVYTAEYDARTSITELSEPLALTADQVSNLISEKTLVIGTGYERLREQFSPAAQSLIVRDPQFDDLPSALNFSTLVEADHHLGHLTDWFHTIPLYIRASEAEEKLKTGSIKALK